MLCSGLGTQRKKEFHSILGVQTNLFKQKCFVKASKKLPSGSKLVAMDTLNAIYDLMSTCEMLSDSHQHHAAHCKLAKKNPALTEKLLQVCKRLLTTLLTITDQMPNAVFFKTCVGFYKRVFENVQLLALFDVSVWLPHIELLFKKVDQIYNECTIQQIRDTFYHAGGSQLLIILR